MKMNYGMIIDERFDVRKFGDLLGVLLAVALLCIAAERQSFKEPVKEAAGRSQDSSENMAGEMGIISDISTESRLRKIVENIAGIPSGQTILSPESLAVLPESPKAEAKEKGPQTTDLEYPMTIQTVAGDVPEEPKPVPEDPAGVSDHTDTSSKDTGQTEEIFSCRGFLCDASGKIIGCDGSISVTDGVLCLPSDERCTGVAAGAFSGLEAEIFEIYIPANIIMIEEGAFDGLTELFFIQVHPGNPVYGSSQGELFKK